MDQGRWLRLLFLCWRLPGSLILATRLTAERRWRSRIGRRRLTHRAVPFAATLHAVLAKYHLFAQLKVICWAFRFVIRTGDVIWGDSWVRVALIQPAWIPPIHGVIAGVRVQVRPTRDARRVFRQPAPQRWVIVPRCHVV